MFKIKHTQLEYQRLNTLTHLFAISQRCKPLLLLCLQLLFPLLLLLLLFSLFSQSLLCLFPLCLFGFNLCRQRPGDLELRKCKKIEVLCLYLTGYMSTFRQYTLTCALL